MRKTLMLLVMVVLLNTAINTVSAEPANAVSPMQMKTGIVKSYNEKKKFGFIKEDNDTGIEIYFHESSLIDKPVNKGDKVKFDVQEGRSGLIAVNIKKI